MKILKKRNNKHGSAIAELPGALMLLITGIAFPVIIYGTFFYRIYMFDCLVKNSCQLGASQKDLPTAIAAVQTYLLNNRLNGVSVPTSTVTVITRTTNYSTPGPPPVSNNYDSYFLQVSANCQISPLVPMPSFFGTVIPGLSGSLPMGMSTQTYFENQEALASGS